MFSSYPNPMHSSKISCINLHVFCKGEKYMMVKNHNKSFINDLDTYYIFFEKLTMYLTAKL